VHVQLRAVPAAHRTHTHAAISTRHPHNHNQKHTNVHDDFRGSAATAPTATTLRQQLR
jgi:hypothetical protein